MGVTIFQMTSTIMPSPSSQNLVYFNFFLKSKIYNIAGGPDSTFADFIDEESHEAYAEHHQIIDKYLYENETAVALDRVLTSLISSKRVREKLIEYGLHALHQILTTPPICCHCQNQSHFKVNLDFDIESVRRRFYYSPNDIGECRMVPATKSSIQSLNKSEVFVTEDQSCSICLEDLKSDEEELLSMPCEHVFHSGCIEKWLSTSHYCPLCRFEMPIATP